MGLTFVMWMPTWSLLLPLPANCTAKSAMSDGEVAAFFHAWWVVVDEGR